MKNHDKGKNDFYFKEEESSSNESNDSDEKKVLFLRIAEEMSMKKIQKVKKRSTWK